jgi:deferrochelatase/peroxidase EfeB
VSAEFDFSDVQGLLRFGYKHHTESAFALLRVRNRAAARAWLASAQVGTAVKGALPKTVLQVAFSADGLRELGVPAGVMAGFAPEFVGGLGTDANRARRLGDVGPNDPARWEWGGAGTDAMPHVLVMVFALPGQLAAFGTALESHWAVPFELMRWLATTDMDGVEPFGFTDGVSQPEIDWARELPAEDHDSLAYRNLACLGEFLLGYPNEYGRYSARPLLDPAGANAVHLPRAEDAPERADLGRNGSYLVLRTLRQDVPGFWRFLHAQAGGDAAERQRIAEAMVGRRMDGQALVEPAATAIAGVGDDAAARARNGFTFDDDKAGVRCPVGAHIRRANPRNADLPAGTQGLVARAVRMLGFDSAALHEDAVASVRFHRVLRRGREYGRRMSPAEALAAPSGTASEAGLHFVCLCADLARQFEFVQGAWIAGTKFAALPHEGDPLLGNRLAAPDEPDTARFTMPRAGCPSRVVQRLPTFIDVVGGAYFFLPGVRALRYLVTT